MGCQSSVILGNNLSFTICTHDPDTGVLTDADAVPAYRVYEDETAAAILNGNMAKLDDANTTGFYSELIACTSGNGFEVGKSYNIYIEATVDGDEGGISYGFECRDVHPVLGTDDKVLISADAQDLSGSLDVNTKLIEGVDATDQIRDAVVDDATRIDASDLNALGDVANIASLAIDASGHVEANVVEISDDATAADNLELMYDGTGLAAVENAIADALLKRDWTAVAGEAARSALNAFRFLRNKWAIVTGTLTVYEEDDTTSAWTAAITDDAAADNVVTLDPA
jgi:hypothetical protein